MDDVTARAVDAGLPDRRAAVVVSASGLRFSWPASPVRIEIDELRVAPGERWLLEGPSGAGKSTLLQLLGGVTTIGAARPRENPFGHGAAKRVSRALAAFVRRPQAAIKSAHGSNSTGRHPICKCRSSAFATDQTERVAQAPQGQFDARPTPHAGTNDALAPTQHAANRNVRARVGKTENDAPRQAW